MSSPNAAPPQGPSLDLFTSASPRQSETSLSTLQLNDTNPKISPLALLIHASTSTISRDSDSRPPSSPTPCLNLPLSPTIPTVAAARADFNFAIPPLFPEPLSMGRIPKGRVFVHRDRDRPRPAAGFGATGVTASTAATSGLSNGYNTANCPSSNRSPAFVERRLGTPQRRPEKRCISDLQGVARRAALASKLGSTPPPPRVRQERLARVADPSTERNQVATGTNGTATAMRHGARYAQQRARSDLMDADGCLGRQSSSGAGSGAGSGVTRDTVPSWIPEDELRDWSASPKLSKADDDDVCGDGLGGVADCDAISSASEEESGGANDAMLDESRWGASLRNLTGLYARARHRPAPAIRGSVLEVAPPTLTERLGLPVRGERRQAQGHGRGHVSGTQEDGVGGGGVGPARDEYVGFLAKNERGAAKAVRRGWRQFLRRARS